MIGENWRFRALVAMILALSSCGRKEEANPPMVPASGIVVIGEVVRRSKLPDPKRSDYPDCDFSCELTVHEILSKERTPRRIVVVLPGFRKRVAHWCATVPSGGMLELSLLTAAAAPQEIK